MVSFSKKFLFLFFGFVLLITPLVTSAAVQIVGCEGKAFWDSGKCNASATGLPDESIYQIISSTLSWLLGILGFIAIGGFVVSGLMYLTAAGDEGRAEKAKEAMKYSVTGVIVALVGFVAIRAIEGLLTANTYF